jgi:hypothetical protein
MLPEGKKKSWQKHKASAGFFLNLRIIVPVFASFSVAVFIFAA